MSKFQSLQRVEAAFKKAGAVIEPQQYGSGYRATKGNREVVYYTQPAWPDETKKVVSLMITRSPHTDTMTDCFCDQYHNTIAAAVYELNRAD